MGKRYQGGFIDSNTGANACIKCGKCEKVCPQHISIIDKLEEAHTALTTA